MMWKRLKNPIRNMKLQKKLLLSYLFVVIVPVIFIGYFFFSNMTEESLKQDSYVNGVNFQQTVNNINNFFNGFTQLSANIEDDSQLIGLLNKQYAPGTDFSVKYFDYYGVSSSYQTKLVYQSINDVNVSIYTSNSQILHDGSLIIQSSDADKASDWYIQAQNSQGLDHIGKPFLNVNKYIIPMCRLLNTHMLATDVLKIDIPETLLYTLIEKESANKTIYILNNENDVISSTSRKDIGKNIRDLVNLQNIVPDISHLSKEIVINNKKQTIFIDRLGSQAPLSECKVIDIVSTKSLIGQLHAITNYSLLICFFAVLVDITLIFLFSHQLSTRLKKLVTSMSKVRDGKFDITVHYEGRDEIDELSRSFDEMLTRIKTLINEVYTSELHVKNLEIKTKEAEIHALQSQINPHFLFNTLESINTSVLKNHDFETADMIVSLSRLIRKSIDWKNDLIPLRQELELVDDYLKMQKFRFREKLEYTIHVDDRYSEVLIPKFTLQPFIENAICHGIETLPRGGHLRISDRSEPGRLSIVIADDGPGIKPEDLQRIRAGLDSWKSQYTGNGIGILNVHQRLRMYYGEDFGVSIESEEGRGTAVFISIPLPQTEDASSKSRPSPGESPEA